MVEKRRQFIINFIYFGLIAGLTLFSVRFVFNYMMPFVFGFMIAYLLKPVVKRLTKVFGDRKHISLIVIVLFYLLIGFLLVWFMILGINTVGSLANSIPEFYNSTLHPMVLALIEWFEGVIEVMDPSISEQILPIIDSVFNSITNFLPGFAASVGAKLTSLVTSVPSVLISVLIAIIASFFFTTDYKAITHGMLHIVPERQRKLIVDIRDGVVSVLGKYLRAYAILMSLTFVELSVVFLVLGLSNPIGLALLIASIDILPVLGTGTVMIPWALIEIAVGNRQLGLILGLVYIVITIIRNVLEPKVVGKQIGLHPLLTLVCIYVGLKLFGFIGLLGLPIAATLIKSLYEEGKLDFAFNEPPVHHHDDEIEIEDLKIDELETETKEDDKNETHGE